VRVRRPPALAIDGEGKHHWASTQWICAVAVRAVQGETFGASTVTWLVPSEAEVTVIQACPRSTWMSSLGSVVPRVNRNSRRDVLLTA